MKNLMAVALAFTFVFVGAASADAYHGIPKWEGDTSATTKAAADCTNCHYVGGSHVPPSDLSWHPESGEEVTPEYCANGCHNTVDPDGEADDEISQYAAIERAIYDAGEHGGSTDCGSCHNDGPTVVWAIDETDTDTTNDDVDNDGLSAAYEDSLGTLDTEEDSDGDGINDFDEVNGYTSGGKTVYSNAAAMESDHDALYDQYELLKGLNPGQPGDKTNGAVGTVLPTKEVEVTYGTTKTTLVPTAYDSAACEPDDTVRPGKGTLTINNDSVNNNFTVSYKADKKNSDQTPMLGKDQFEVQYVGTDGKIYRQPVNVNVVAAPPYANK